MGVEGHLHQVCLGKAVNASHWLSPGPATLWVLNTCYPPSTAQHLTGLAGMDLLPSKVGGRCSLLSGF